MLYAPLPCRMYKNAQITSGHPNQSSTVDPDCSYSNNLHQTPADRYSSVLHSGYLQPVSASGWTYFHSKPPHSYTGKLHLDEDVPHGRHNDNDNFPDRSYSCSHDVPPCASVRPGCASAVIIVMFETVANDAVSIMQDKSAVPNFLKRFIITPPCNCKMKCSPF